MIDVNTETVVPLSKSGIPGSPSLPTLWRWRRKGVKGVKLETVSIGTRVYTSREAVARFIERTTAAANNEPTPVRSPAARERAIARAERELAAEGI